MARELARSERNPAGSRAAARDFGHIALLPASRSAFFATAPSAKISDDSELVLTDAGDVLHAKMMGTGSTACGVDAASWPKLWDQPFYKGIVPRCPQCIVLVAQAQIRP